MNQEIESYEPKVSKTTFFDKNGESSETEPKDVCAKKVETVFRLSNNEENTLYFVKCVNGKLFNPQTMVESKSQRASMVKVKYKVFNYYLTFLTHKSRVWLSYAEREF